MSADVCEAILIIMRSYRPIYKQQETIQHLNKHAA